MKTKTILLTFLLLLSAYHISPLSQGSTLSRFPVATPGEVIEVSCSDPYPTLGQPTNLIIMVQGNAGNKFNQTLIITDEFAGFVSVAGEMKWVTGTVLIGETVISIGKLPRYIKKIPWYPSVVGNHTVSVTTATSTSTHLNVSVGFDVEGIIFPSLGAPALINKDTKSHLVVTLSEERSNFEEPIQVLQLGLHDINNPSSYMLKNQSMTWRTWVNAGADVIEDELMVSYDIESIPEGFYNLSVTTAKDTYRWPHAVRIRNSEPTDYSIVQLSDIHIGKYSNPVNKKKELTRLFTYIDEQIQPDFVILSGDSVDWYNQRYRRNPYLELQEALLSCRTPVFTVPGNHERYSNSLLFLYFPFTNLTPYHRFLNPLNDYSISMGAVNFVFLDSGYEYSRWEIQPKIWNLTPEGSGLSNTQVYLLDTHWGDPEKNQIVILHHPAVNDENDTGLGAVPNDLPSGNNECIAQNRGVFISYCVSNNVSLILSGHTHKNKVLTALGKNPDNPTAWPLFVQTPSATLSRQNNGGRLIRIQDNCILSYDYLPFQ